MQLSYVCPSEIINIIMKYAQHYYISVYTDIDNKVHLYSNITLKTKGICYEAFSVLIYLNVDQSNVA